MACLFKFRLNCIDNYQTKPTVYDPQLQSYSKAIETGHGLMQPKIPVIRIFGSTEDGQKVCAHIHGVFPYLYVEYNGGLSPDEVRSYILTLRQSIDHALALSYRRDLNGNKAKFVAHITLVKGIPFYGFHVGYRYFLKIYMLNPMVMTRLCDLLHQGLVMKRSFQPYEAHISYLLQFMTDFNLYGCDYVCVSRIRFRAPVPGQDFDSPSQKVWNFHTIDPELIVEDVNLPRASHCALEVDVCAHDILNRRNIQERNLHHDFVELNNPSSSSAKLVPSLVSLWKDETARRNRVLGNTTNNSSPFPPEVLVPMSAEPRVSQMPRWVQTSTLWEEIRGRIEEEALESKSNLGLSDFIPVTPTFATNVKSTLESVQDLFFADTSSSTGTAIDDSHQGIQDKSAEPNAAEVDVQVDEKGVLSFTEEGNTVTSEVIDRILLGAKGEQTPRKPRLFRSQAASTQVFTQRPLSSRDLATLEGIGKSCLRTGNPAALPSYETVLDFIEDEAWLFNEDKRHRPLDNELNAESTPRCKLLSVAKHRKKRELLALSESESKRLKTDLKFSQFESVSATQRNPPDKSRPSFTKSSLNSKATKHLASQQTNLVPSVRKPILPSTPSSRKTAPPTMVINRSPHGIKSLNFPVVKDPHDSSSRLRPSQKSLKSQHGNGNTPTRLETLPSTKEGALDLSTAQETPRDDNEQNVSQKSRVTSVVSFVPQEAAPTDTKQTAGHHQSSSAIATLETMQTVNAVQQSTDSTSVYVFRYAPLHAEQVSCTTLYQQAYYSNPEDVPARPREYAGREFRLTSNTLSFLPDFNPDGAVESQARIHSQYNTIDLETFTKIIREDRCGCTIRAWEVAHLPPSRADVQRWGDWAYQLNAPTVQPSIKACISQVEGGHTQMNKHGFKHSLIAKSSADEQVQYMSIMSVEIHIKSRQNLTPNPVHDPVEAIFWAMKSDEADNAVSPLPNVPWQSSITQGIIVLSEDGHYACRIRSQVPLVDVIDEQSELGMFSSLVTLVRLHDPDIITGFEVHSSSWGYLIERAKKVYDFDLCGEISRMKIESYGLPAGEPDRWGLRQTSSIHVTGRHVINIWRAMRSELALLQYTMESVVWHVCHKRMPRYSWKTLTQWWDASGRPRDLHKVVMYYLARTRLDLEILEKNELVPRVSEQARLLGVDFFSVFNRGSQFKVESMMLRLAKPENFLLVSPSRKQVGGQNALECLPLVMEPQSNFYTSPVIILDFQSLYPSIMIAYNYCYSTFLGRVTNWRGRNKMGFTTYNRPVGLLGLIKDEINVSPNGMMFVKPTVRRSLLAKMLCEILETRVMIKSGMKFDKDDRALQQLLNHRQMALKLFANVTYGYTSASFSGRMPCAEIADSIVQTGRETLERSIAYIHSVDHWNAEVVYGDTDSLFIHLPGRTRAQAFVLGQEMADAITKQNPRPMKLKFEKVYHPCVLLAKKRYVGYKYESPSQQKPEFEAKGIETVRRDGTPAEQKIEEKCLKILFKTADLSQVKEYFQAQVQNIALGKVSIQDFCFAKEVKLGTYSANAVAPPGAIVATRKLIIDERAIPEYGERIPYVVIAGAPGARLVDRCVDPVEVVKDGNKSLDVEYYVTKSLIPPLERIFNLVGADVRSWWDQMPRIQRVKRIDPRMFASSSDGELRRADWQLDGSAVAAAATLEGYLATTSCLACGMQMSRDSPAADAADHTDGTRDMKSNKHEEAHEQKSVIPSRTAAVKGMRMPNKRVHGRSSPTVTTATTTIMTRSPSAGSHLSAAARIAQPEPTTGLATGAAMPLCKLCTADSTACAAALARIHTRLATEQSRLLDLHSVCRTCEAGSSSPLDHSQCESRDCPVWYSRMKQETKLRVEEFSLNTALKALRMMGMDW